MNKRPLSVAVIGCVYMLTGMIGFVYHFTEFKARNPFPYDTVWVELVSVVAIVCGAYMLRGNNWARWLALAWMAFHVIVSAFHTRWELAIHVLFLAILASLLLRPAAARFFRAAKT